MSMLVALIGVLAMQAMQFVAPSLDGFFDRVESSEPYSLAVQLDLGAILPSSSIKADALRASGVVLEEFHVVGILPARGLSQVAESVVGLDQVSMVDLVLRPYAINVEPREPVSSKAHREADGDVDVVAIHNASDGSGIPSVPRGISIRALLPSEDAGLRIVTENTPDKVQAKSGFPLLLTAHLSDDLSLAHFGDVARGLSVLQSIIRSH